MVIFPTLCIAAMVTGGFCMTSRHRVPWLITAWLLATCLLLAYRHVRIRHYIGRQVSNNPGLVYWAHTSSSQDPSPDVDVSNSTLIVLHLRNGTQLEVGLPIDEMRTLITWLRIRNPSIRWGSYDSAEITEMRSPNNTPDGICQPADGSPKL
jgi:hypothetical protein